MSLHDLLYIFIKRYWSCCFLCVFGSCSWYSTPSLYSYCFHIHQRNYPWVHWEAWFLSLIYGTYLLFKMLFRVYIHCSKCLQIFVHSVKLQYMESPLFQTIVHTRLALTLMAVFSFPLGKFLAPRRENLHCSVIPLCWSVGHQKKDGLLQWVHKYF